MHQFNLKYNVAILVSVVLLASSGRAQTSSVTQIKPETMDHDKNLGILASIEYSQKVAVDEKSERESATSILLAPSYKLSGVATLSAKAILNKDNYGPRNTTLSHTTISLAIKGFQLSDKLTTTHALLGVIPTDEQARKEDRLQGAIGISNGLKLDTQLAQLDYKLQLKRNFHEYTVNFEGRPNIEYTLSNALAVTIPITDKFSFISAGIYKNGRTYKGFERTSFELNFDINYDFTPQLSLNLGTSNDGNALKANGVDSNISAYNEDTSVSRLGLSYNY